MFGVYVAIAAPGIFLYGRLSADVEIDRQATRTASSLSPQSRSRMIRLAALFSMDAFGGGFMVRSYMSFWLVSKFGLDLSSIAAVFFAGQLLNAVSVMLAAPVAARIGLINTMAWTQAVSNTLMIVIAFAGNVWLAIALLLARELSNDMDIPTRQSYTMAIVPPEAMTATAGITNLGRNVTQTISPVLAGLVAQLTFLGAPFIIGGGVKLVYNAALYVMFRGVKAPGDSPE
jgi:MFS family permease